MRAGEHGRPETVDGRAVEAVRESWLVEDRWWTPAPVRRRYWEVVTACGRNLIVFRDLGRAAGMPSAEDRAPPSSPPRWRARQLLLGRRRIAPPRRSAT